MNSPTRVAFMGSDPIARPLLDYLHDDASEVELAGIFTQPDRPAGRGMQLRPNAIKQWALERSLTVRQPERKCGPEDEDWLRREHVDLLFVMAFGQLLPRSLIETPERGTVNFHASLLPRLRGASPIHTAVASGESQTGVSLMRIVPKLDAGPVADAQPVPIAPEAQVAEVIAQLAEACVPLLARNLRKLCAGTASFEPQAENEVTYCRRIAKSDARLDFHRPAQALHDHIRAFQPWPGARLEVGEFILKIGRARLVRATGGAPGTLLVENRRAFVQCGDDSLELLELQRPGGRMLPTPEFLKGSALSSGATATSHRMEPLVAHQPFVPVRKAGT